MPEKQTIERARRDKREGKSPSTQAGEFVREEVHHVREGKHGARSAKQAIAIGLSKARRASVASRGRPPRRARSPGTLVRQRGSDPHASALWRQRRPRAPRDQLSARPPRGRRPERVPTAAPNAPPCDGAGGPVYQPDCGTDMIDCCADARVTRAVRAAEEPAVGLDAVADDPAAAVVAGRRQLVDGALEAVEHVAVAGRDHLEREVVVVPAHFALCHGSSQQVTTGRSARRMHASRSRHD